MTRSRTTRRSCRALGLAGAGLALVATAPPALANEGSLYPSGVPDPAGKATPTWTVDRFGDEFFASAAAGIASVGPKAWWHFSTCDRPGSFIESVTWAGKRTATSTSRRLSFNLTGNGDLVNLGDLAVTPGYTNFARGVGGSCEATLSLNQVGAGTEPIRSYWVAAPRAWIRDVWGPSAALTGVTGGWVTGGSARINWAASDNFGSDGMGQHRVYVGPHNVWAGSPGESAGHGIDANVGAIPDGIYPVSVQVDGDGTGGTSAGGANLLIDRTPPAANIAPTVTGPGRATAPLDVADNLSQTAEWHVYAVHAGGQTEIASHATGWSNSVDLSAYNGQDVRFRVTARDNAGNGNDRTSGALRIDTTAPVAAISSAPTGWIKDFEGANALGASLRDNRADGLGPVAIEIFKATDGTTGGGAATVAAYNGAGQPTIGQSAAHRLSFRVDGLGLADGVHRIRMSARDPHHAELASTAEATVKLDLTTPELGDPTGYTVTRAAGRPDKADLATPGVTDATSGLAKIEVYVNTDPTGDPNDLAKYKLAGLNTTPTQGLTTSLDLSSFVEGVHAVRIFAYDQAGNASFADGGFTITTDRTLPTIPAAEIGSGGIVKWSQRDNNGFGVCPTTVEMMGPGTGGEWVSVHEVAGSALAGGDGSFQLPIEGMAGGAHQVRVTVCDASGNTATTTRSFLWQPTTNFNPPATIITVPGPGGASPGGSNGSPGGNGANGRDEQSSSQTPLARVQIPGVTSPEASLYRRIDGRLVPVIRVRYGTRITLLGKFVREDGSPVAETAVVVRDSANRRRASSTTAADGRFRTIVKAVRGGLWTVAATADGHEVRTQVELKVAPVVKVSVRNRLLRQGQKLVVRGSLIPASEAYGKRIQLQRKDGRRWRPVADGRVARSGRFVFRYQFRRQGGHAVSMRIAAPKERGWAFAPVVSPIFLVRIGEMIDEEFAGRATPEKLP